MDVQNVDLTISAVEAKQYPNTRFPEIAFVGRSNVGKSSLTNVLINRKGYARTSSQPGKTQTLNFYNIEDKLFFVDVPGYGYAKTSKANREKWGKMIEKYLTEREQLRGVITLVDGRHAPTNDDVSMHEWLKYYGIEILTVATKMDKIAKGKWNKQESLIRKTLNLDANEKLISFSALTKQGKTEIWQWIEGRMHQ
ncbi:MAG: ribosome biogenesis GTP-binding protein YihA/YsxC [Lentilactobacillus hilgardii]|jgi:GTP-binding protein|uniref:Probable GTP-binding protein EngB n=2 Tax=Lentilactobacillus hilgardii TaxID=1588 RepID=C0XKR3_LENH9|nr:ribosome biogenesis GTP-binding protein YihA/YsxC [Lentilactobacillus hilgardii]EEI19861.1 ribosome biogenesis GTP-binding protein YsxC [Lentilactobacillus buchneri ATCC 11577]RRG07482.1 MAG: YihA family ribosome biogenesis GTP-binding protein [Lactobacillus sp.]EEI24058.1 ribosome biogenesis GTP-binding protein YsxC [Lentilactobacillus hilgardii DSM 20176 = ATCC 8290]EEI71227.1 ribosome biogenesis GTP-binding protein YsxC [Lentilactobacillus hilgardii ATCC 27305]KRK57934.1 GTPase [Lentilac